MALWVLCFTKFNQIQIFVKQTYSFFIPGNATELATLSLPECIQTKKGT